MLGAANRRAAHNSLLIWPLQRRSENRAAVDDQQGEKSQVNRMRSVAESTVSVKLTPECIDQISAQNHRCSARQHQRPRQEEKQVGIGFDAVDVTGPCEATS